MTFKGNHIWEATATFNPISGQSMRWEIDLKGDWTQNYGDNSPTNGVLDANGADIIITTAGTYAITANDSTLTYTVTPQTNCTAPEATVNPTTIDLGNTVPGDSKTGLITVSNNCPSEPLTIRSIISDNASWLTTGLSDTIVNLTANATGLTEGSYNATVTINTNGGNISVPVSLAVSTSNNVTISFTCHIGTT